MSDESWQSTRGRILVDDVTPEPILDFEAYSNAIVNMITHSHPKFSVGIYGEWGSGKTTLMKLIQNKLNSFVQEGIFVWEDIQKNQKNEEITRLKAFLRDNFEAGWIDNSELVIEGIES